MSDGQSRRQSRRFSPDARYPLYIVINLGDRVGDVLKLPVADQLFAPNYRRAPVDTESTHMELETESRQLARCRFILHRLLLNTAPDRTMAV